MTDEALKMRLCAYQDSLNVLADQIKLFEKQNQSVPKELLKAMYQARFLILRDYLRDAELASRNAGLE